MKTKKNKNTRERRPKAPPIYVVLEWVNIKRALLYLSKYDPERYPNPLKRSKVDRYVADMQQGSWKNPATAIQFLQDGTLGNGLHTLTALTESGLPGLYLLVGRGYVPDDIAFGTDRCEIRSVPNSTNYVGIPFPPRTVACVRQMIYELTGQERASTHSLAALLAFYKRHRNIVDEALSLLTPKKKDISCASVDAAFAIAGNSLPFSQLQRAAHILHNGTPSDDLQPGDRTMVLLSRQLLTEPKGGGANRRRIRQAMLYGLSHFADGKDLRQLHPPERYGLMAAPT